ncbi:transposase [Crocinitomix catalasitica]|uniref:transposase n=1 Tax=Crocinitomix catalasitica TaxID=184607 RepID=UPI000560D829|nr:transposase [Crocinitomix catalasitica]
MSTKFQNKYRIESTRLQNWDYRWDGAYFITICTKNRDHYFGKIINGKMVLSNIGVLANVFWHEIKNHTKNVKLGEFVVMPDHIHGVLILKGNKIENEIENHGSTDNMIEALHATPLSYYQKPAINEQKNKTMANISPKSNSISTIIRSYKSAVTKHANRLGFDFAWQPRFYDHIIRDKKSFETISRYIINNPTNWGKDKIRDND